MMHRVRLYGCKMPPYCPSSVKKPACTIQECLKFFKGMHLSITAYGNNRDFLILVTYYSNTLLCILFKTNLMKVLGIIGSLRKNSFNRSLMNAFVAQKPEGATMELADIGTLPHYSEDLETDFPTSAQVLKSQIESADLIIIGTPEYNRSISGVLKNAIDWVSRPYGKNSFSGKKVLVVSASVGPVGGALAHYDLTKILLHLNATVFGQPEFFVGMAGTKFNAEGNLTDEKTKEYITSAWSKITA